MNILGIVAEYNPFHNGHLYQLNAATKEVNPDYTVCVMSGNFIQRGEPALINKFIRTDEAIRNGIDLVIELPTYYALSTSEKFAYAAVKILSECGVNFLSFGCETSDLSKLDDIANLLVEEPIEYSTNLKEQLNLGISYPEARANAVCEILNLPLDSVLNQPNNILAIEYLKAIKNLKCNIQPVPIERIEVGYHDTDAINNIISATGIREKLKNNHDISRYIPNKTSNSFDDLVYLENLEQLILFSLRKLSINDIKKLPDVTEGLENRIYNALLCSSSLNELIDKIKTKRYPLTRIKRILLSALLSLSNAKLKEFDNAGGPQYLRILGCSEKGKDLLSYISKSSCLPLVTSVNQFLSTASNLQKDMLEKDILATNIYTLVCKNKLMNLDFTRRI